MASQQRKKHSFRTGSSKRGPVGTEKEHYGLRKKKERSQETQIVRMYFRHLYS